MSEIIIQQEFKKDFEQMPAVLRLLIEAELAAGNRIERVGHGFPAAPVGAFFQMARPISTRERRTGGGLMFRTRRSNLWDGEFTDDAGHFFVLEPPPPPEEEPDMDAIREGRNRRQAPAEAPRTPLVEKFLASMVIDYDKWHDGIGFDVDLIHQAGPADRAAIEQILLGRGLQGWREVEALAALDSERARAELRSYAERGSTEVRMAIQRHAPDLMPNATKVKALVEALERAPFYGGLTQALDEVATFHPAPVIDALLRGARDRDGEVAVHFAAMLLFVHGKAESEFDWEQRPFFLRFNTEDRAERMAVWNELRERIGAAEPLRK